MDCNCGCHICHGVVRESSLQYKDYLVKCKGFQNIVRDLSDPRQAIDVANPRFVGEGDTVGVLALEQGASFKTYKSRDYRYPNYWRWEEVH